MSLSPGSYFFNSRHTLPVLCWCSPCSVYIDCRLLCTRCYLSQGVTKGTESLWYKKPQIHLHWILDITLMFQQLRMQIQLRNQHLIFQEWFLLIVDYTWINYSLEQFHSIGLFKLYFGEQKNPKLNTTGNPREKKKTSSHVECLFPIKKRKLTCTCKIHRIDWTARLHRKSWTSLNY